MHVNLSSTNLPLRGFEVLLELACQFRDLETIYLRNNALQKEAAMSVAKLLGAKAKLRILDLGDNFLGDSGVAVLAGALTADLSSSKHYRRFTCVLLLLLLANLKFFYSCFSSLVTLTVMDLSSNHCGDSGLMALCRGLMHFAKHLSNLNRYILVHITFIFMFSLF